MVTHPFALNAFHCITIENVADDSVVNVSAARPTWFSYAYVHLFRYVIVFGWLVLCNWLCCMLIISL